MKINKLYEVIDSDGELIGSNDIPEYGSDLETMSNKTTDYNMNVGSQKFKYNTMSMMGFNMIPFYEGKDSDNKNLVMDKLAKYLYEYYIDIIKYYYKNPNKLKNDYRVKSKELFDDTENIEKYYKYSEDIIKIISLFIKNKENIDEDYIIKEKNEIEFNEKSNDNELNLKKINNIAGLLNKLDKNDLKKIINLLEIK